MNITITLLRRLSVLLLVWLGVPGMAGAVSIYYNLTALGGDTYRYDFTINNDGGLPALGFVEGFLYYFADADILAIITNNRAITSNWDEAIFEGTLTDPDAYDAIMTGSTGIAFGGSLSGFVVQFRWNGQGIPAHQLFRNDRSGALDTTRLSVRLSSPETRHLGLLGLGSAGLLAFRRQCIA